MFTADFPSRNKPLPPCFSLLRGFLGGSRKTQFVLVDRYVNSMVLDEKTSPAGTGILPVPKSSPD